MPKQSATRYVELAGADVAAASAAIGASMPEGWRCIAANAFDRVGVATIGMTWVHEWDELPDAVALEPADAPRAATAA